MNYCCVLLTTTVGLQNKNILDYQYGSVYFVYNWFEQRGDKITFVLLSSRCH